MDGFGRAEQVNQFVELNKNVFADPSISSRPEPAQRRIQDRPEPPCQNLDSEPDKKWQDVANQHRPDRGESHAFDWADLAKNLSLCVFCGQTYRRRDLLCV